MENTLVNKKEFIFLDIMKFICSLLVVAIHIPPLVNIDSSFSYWFTQIFSRIAVPFFFICSGFFLFEKLKDKEKFIKYIKRMIIFYGTYTLFYIPQIIYNNTLNDLTLLEDIGMFFRNTLFVASYSHLWFILGIIIASSILYLFVNKFKLSDKKIIIIAIVLYCIGVIGNEYPNLLNDNIVLGKIFEIYCAMLRTTRNGLFFGLLLVSIGYLIKKHSDKISMMSVYPMLLVLTFVIMCMEKYLFLPGQVGNKNDMLFCLPIVTTLLFICCCFVRIDIKYLSIGKVLRNISVIIFGFHLLIKFYLNLYLDSNDITLHSLLFYSIVVLINGVICLVIILLQKRFKKLEYLY